MDKISNLPDEIIVHILSFLSIEEAASTSLLSKRWRDMFVFTPNLRFALTDPMDLNVHKQNFIDFVDRVLAVSGNSAIRRFTLRCHVESALWKRWILNVLNRGVLKLDINARDIDSSLLFQVFACKTLAKLNLSHFNIPMVPEDASLPALKSLSLSLGRFEHLGAFEKLISACTSLEELIINEICCEFWKLSPILSSLTLKQLTTRCYSQNSGIMSFDHPSLLFLHFSGFQHQYPVVNLDSLVQANLELVSSLGDHNPSNLIKGLRNVKILVLFTPQTVEFFGIFREAMPVFKNLVQLSISYSQHFCLYGSHVLSLLNKSPNLHTLVIKGPLRHKYNVDGTQCECFLECSRLSSCPVKVLELIKYDGGDIKELDQMKHFLEGFSCLELVKVCASAKDDKEKLRLTTDLQMLPRASSKCKIQIYWMVKMRKSCEKIPVSL